MKFPKRKISFPIYFFASYLFLACEKDFSIMSNNKEPFPVVYGLLDIADSVHYVKIYKSYRTNENAYNLTTDIHKYSYIDSIEVYLIEYNLQGDILRKIPFDTTTSIPKDSGLFGYPTQIIYRVHANLEINNLYKLMIYNPYTKNIAETKELIALVSPPTIKEPPVYQRYIYIPNDNKNFTFITGKNTTKYFLRIKYFYSEFFLDNTNRQPEPITWTLGEVIDNSMSEGIEKTLTQIGYFFFIRISSEVKEDPNVYRRHTDSILYEIYAAAKDWDLYQQSTTPARGINQEQLYHSNMKAYNMETKEEKYVMGFFSSRTKTVKHYQDLYYPGPRDSLFSGRFTGHLNFTFK